MQFWFKKAQKKYFARENFFRKRVGQKDSIRKDFVFGGRPSLLSRIQISLAAKRLQELRPDVSLSFFLKQTEADQDLQTALWDMPLQNKGAFSSDFSCLLSEGKIDIAVHSHKDLALEPHPQTEVFPILERADQRDLLLFKKEALRNRKLPHEIVIYTSSLRRMFLLEIFLQKALPLFMQKKKLSFESIRGNIPTRLAKFIDSPAHGLVLSKAALDRLLLGPAALSLDGLIQKKELEESQRKIRKILAQCRFMVLPLSLCPNAPAQGSLAAEIRKNDTRTKDLVFCLMEEKNTRTSLEERRHLARFGGGCHQKIGIAVLEKSYGSILCLHGMGNNKKPFLERNLILKSSPPPQEKQEWQPPQSKSKIWPLPGEGLSLKRRPSDHIPSSRPPRHIWVSRGEAWPDAWENPERENSEKKKPGRENSESILWAAGIKTFFSLAKRGLWVHGCADSLGEEEESQIDLLAGEPMRFVKLTHQKSLSSRWESISTYHLRLTENVPDLRQRTHFFWKSSSQFDWVTKAYPEILSAHHACGPGLTKKHIQERALGPIRIFLDYQDWLAFMQKK